MESLNKKEISAEIQAISENIKAHEGQMKLHLEGIKIDSYLKSLLERELEKFK